MTGLRLDKFIPISSVVQSPAITLEKKNLILAMDNSLIPTTKPYYEYSGASALSDFRKDFGANIPEYSALQKYFSFMSKSGTSPEKAIVVRWYRENTAPFVKGCVPATLAELKAIDNGSLKIAFNSDEAVEIDGLDFTTANSYSDIATILQTAINAKTGAEFENATVTYSSITNGFVLTGGVAGLEEKVAITAGETGTDVSAKLGLTNGAVVSVGVNAETYAELCDRVFNMNVAGFAMTTLLPVEDEDVKNSIAWLNSTIGNRTVYTAIKLVFAYTDLTKVKQIATELDALDYTGYVLVYDPMDEKVNILDCAIGASIDYEADNSAVNFNFQPAVGYTSITDKDTAVDYQSGVTNASLTSELDALKISYVYTVGVGSQQEKCYGMGLMSGDFRTENVQINESWLDSDLQNRVMNGFVSSEIVKMQGQDATNYMSALINPSFIQGKANGTIAQNGTLLDNDKLSVSKIFGAEAVDAIELNGFYYQIQEITAEDIANQRCRVKVAYLTPGVVNQVRIINTIYGA